MPVRVADALRRYVAPRYWPWLLANVAVYAVVVWQLRAVVVDPGQGGRVDVFIWPDYWASYHLQDVMLVAVPEFEWGPLVGNYLVALLPVYVALNVAFNALVAEPRRSWTPTVTRWRGLGLFVLLAVLFAPVHVFGFPGILLWVALATTATGAVAWGVRESWRSRVHQGR